MSSRSTAIFYLCTDAFAEGGFLHFQYIPILIYLTPLPDFGVLFQRMVELT